MRAVAREYVIAEFETQTDMFFHPVLHAAAEVATMTRTTQERSRVAPGHERHQFRIPIEVVRGSSGKECNAVSARSEGTQISDFRAQSKSALHHSLAASCH